MPCVIMPRGIGLSWQRVVHGHRLSSLVVSWFWYSCFVQHYPFLAIEIGGLAPDLKRLLRQVRLAFEFSLAFVLGSGLEIITNCRWPFLLSSRHSTSASSLTSFSLYFVPPVLFYGLHHHMTKR